MQAGRGAIIYFDGVAGTGARIEQASNVFDIEGIRIDIASASAGQTFNIETTQNVDDVMDMIRDFINHYNDLIRQLNALHSTTRPTQRGNRSFFEPLTDEQRQAMSDRDIEQWEAQARTGLLHRDSQLRNLHNQIRSIMFEPVRLADGSQFALHQLGVTTVGLGGAREDRLIGVLQIDEDQLREQLEADPERVRAVFSRSGAEVGDDGMPGGTVLLHNDRRQHVGVVHRLRDILHDTVENQDSIFRHRVGAPGWDDGQNILGRQIADYDQRIGRMEQFLIRRENHFFAMFARMEAAMAQSHAQMDALFAFGGQ
jgi:flagellar hook-associated protein 2